MKYTRAESKPQTNADERGWFNGISHAKASQWMWRLKVGRVAPRAPQDGAEPWLKVKRHQDRAATFIIPTDRAERRSLPLNRTTRN
jgi:hypothetical protein